MSDAKVPIIGGYHEADQSEQRLLDEAEKIGYPVMIKVLFIFARSLTVYQIEGFVLFI